MKNNQSESQDFCLEPTQWPLPKQQNKPASFRMDSSESSSSKKPLVMPGQLTLDFTHKAIVCVNESGRWIGQDHIRAKYTDEEVEHVLWLREEGYTLREIARMTEIPLRTVRGYIDGTRRNQQPARWKVVRRL